MIEYSDIVNKVEFGIELAKHSKKYVMQLRADGPLNCSDESKVNEVWKFYEDKIQSKVFFDLKQYGEIFIYFEGSDYAHECLQEWVVPKKLLQDEEYGLDMDYYIFAEITGPNGEGMGFN